MLGSWFSNSTLREQIKNILLENIAARFWHRSRTASQSRSIAGQYWNGSNGIRSFRGGSSEVSMQIANTRENGTRADDLDLLDRYWRAANYLSVGQIYLLDNPLLGEPLRPDHIKPRLLGHWGTTPGLNFIYAHLNRAIRAADLNVIYVCGPRPWRAGNGRQYLSRRHLQRDLSRH